MGRWVEGAQGKPHGGMDLSCPPPFPSLPPDTPVGLPPRPPQAGLLKGRGGAWFGAGRRRVTALGCRVRSSGVGGWGGQDQPRGGGGLSAPNWPPALPCPPVVTAHDSVSPARSDSQGTAGGGGPGYNFGG